MEPAIPVHEDDVKAVSLLVSAHSPFLFFAEHEPNRVRALLTRVGAELDLPLLEWRLHRGLGKADTDGQAVYKTESPAACLAHLRSAGRQALYYLLDFERFLPEAEIEARLLELHDDYSNHRGAVILSGEIEVLPSKLARLFTVVHLRTPTIDAYHEYVAQVLAEVRARQTVRVRLSSEDVLELLEHLRGMPFHEVRKLVTQALVKDGELSRDDIEFVLDAKKRIIERVGLLEYVPVDPEHAQVRGLHNLRAWLEKRRIAFAEPSRAQSMGLEVPRGVLLTGIQGCGKSLSAKAFAAAFRMPLVRLDPGALFRKYFGESEQNLRRALVAAEAISPCVLWIDEIEKAFGSGSGDQDGGTSKRVFGNFLTWLAEKEKSVFVFATANDISGLPPELMRKGRFDEIFFVDLPSEEIRREIFRLHLARRKHTLDEAALDELARETEGFSGAEIEQAVISALYSALSEGCPLSQQTVLSEVRSTRPLSVIQSEKIAALRAWAKDRAVFVD